ncbi:anti-sigma factor family protein [Rhizobium rhizoryzae]|uniref:Anti-sigma factor RsiW n=1 Tax=Rhizobium rhizoryzae TaxID=451876 RepID=A0A7W6PQF4_9HYPH|nr:anti-sigma factor [Rhizobium rhizoryzae]MBB4141630.1 anti-sigma factor RsiW [Rhizobium rhizoryzae]
MSDNLRQPSLDARLSAMLDGEVTEAEKSELDDILANDPNAKLTSDKLRQATEHGRTLFNEMLKEPVSLSLVRSIKTAPEGRRALRFPKQETVRQKLKPTYRLAITSSVIMFALGAAAGYMVGAPSHMMTYADIAGDPSKAWLDDVASHYRLFSRQSRHLVEIPANESAHIVEWLMATTGISFRIPDLTSEKLVFMGARLFSAGGRPVGELIYQNRDGEVIAICFTKFISPMPEKDMRESIRDDIGMVTWQGLQASYVLTGPSSDADLEGLATKIAGII